MTSARASAPIRRLRAARAILGLASARARRRRSAATLVALSVAGSIVVLGALLGVGVVAADQATRQALADLPSPERLISVHRSTLDDAEADLSDGTARAAMVPILGFTDPIVPITLYQPPRDPARVVAIDDVARWVGVKQGRLPKPCDGGATCEVIRIGDFPFDLAAGQGLIHMGEIGQTVELGNMRLVIVGVGDPSPDLPLEQIRPDGLNLVVDGVVAMRHARGPAVVPRSSFWIAPIDPNRVHGWQLDDLAGRLDEVRRNLASAGSDYLLIAPEQTLEAVQARTAIAVGRLVFISSLIVGVLLAFAAFAAAVERNDVGLEYGRLRTAGAGRAELTTFVAVEALVPAVVGAVLGSVLAALAVAAIATSQRAPVDVLIWLALLQPGALGLILLLAALAVVAVALGIHPDAGRLVHPRLIATAAVPVILVLGWDRLASGPVDPAALAAQPTSPGTVLLPGLLGLVVILGSLVVLPPLFRRLARVGRRAPLSVRLATISIAREPLRPAATLTLLAFSLGAVVFGLAYAATLRQGATDEAAFLAGMDIRLQPLGSEGRFATDVLPALRSGALGGDVETHPMTVLTNGESATRQSFSLAGIEADALPELRGWRSDFSGSSPAEIAAAIALAGDWTMAGQAIPDGDQAVTVDIDSTGDQVHLDLVVEQANGEVRYLPMGDLLGGRQTFHVDLFEASELATRTAGVPAGWKVLGVIASNGGEAAVGQPFSGARQQADVTIHGLEAILDPGQRVHLDVSGERSGQLVRPAARTDGLTFPALVSPELAADVGPGGILDVTVGSGLHLRLRPVAIATQFPTLITPGPGGFAVVDLAPLLLAMNAHDPGSGFPNEALLRTPSDVRTAAVADALGTKPFPVMTIHSRPAIEARRADDPFALGIVWGLAIGAVAGLALSVAGVLMAAAADLRDERGELWELESQGIRPRSLAGLMVLRTALLCATGIVAGIAIGLGLGWFVATGVSVTGEGAQPIPPLVLVAPWVGIAALGMSLLVGLAFAVLVLARRHFAGPAGSGPR